MYSQTDQMLNQASSVGYSEQKAQRDPMAVSVVGQMDKQVERLKVVTSQLEARLCTVCRSESPSPEPNGITKAAEIMPPLLNSLAAMTRRIGDASNVLESVLRRLEI